jgi:hypothetical protein
MALRVASIIMGVLCGVLALAQSTSNQVTNADIAKMLKAGVDQKVVKWVVENSDGTKLDSSPAAIQALRAAGASPVVLDALSKKAGKTKNAPAAALTARKRTVHPTKVTHAASTVKRLSDPKSASRTASEINSLQPETCADNLQTVDDCHDNYKAGCTHSEHPNYDAYLDYLKNSMPDPASPPSSVNQGNPIDAAFLSDHENNTPDTLTAYNHAQHAPDLSDMGEGQVVSVIGTLFYTIHGGAESVNCQLSGDESLVDFHIGIGFSDFPLGADVLGQLRSGSDFRSVLQLGDQLTLEQNSFVVEMTPYYREQFKSGWTLRKVQSVTGRQVKVNGQLMIDNFHHKSSDDCGLADANPDKCWRLSVWEIHPVTSFQVCSADHCDANSTNWVNLEDM